MGIVMVEKVEEDLGSRTLPGKEVVPKLNVVKNVWVWISVIALCSLSLFIFRQASSRTVEIKSDMTQFFKLIEAMQYQKAYDNWTTKSYRKGHSLARFVAAIQVLGGPHTLKARELFISFRRSTLRGEIQKKQGRLYSVAFHVRKRQGRQKVYAFQITESVAGVSTAFLKHLQKKEWDKAYSLTSKTFRKHISRAQIPKWAATHGILGWHSFHWSMVDNYSKNGQVSGMWRLNANKMGSLAVFMEREKGLRMIASVQVRGR